MANEVVPGRLTAYQRGARSGIAGTNVCLLVETDPSGDEARSLWDRVQDPLSAADLNELISGRSSPLASTRNFGMVGVCDGQVHIVLSGDTSAQVVSSLGEVTLGCPVIAKVAVYRLESPPEKVRILTTETSSTREPFLPLSGGIVPASALAVNLSSTRGPSGTAPVVRATVAARTTTNLSLIEQPASSRAAATEETIAFSSDANVVVEASVVEDSYDHLFGHTINRSVEEAAVRATAEEDIPEPTDAVALASSPSAPRPAPEPPPALGVTTSEGMIESVPGSSPTPSGQHQNHVWSPSPADPPDMGELTISRSAQRALMHQMSAPGHLQTVGPSVHAVRCPMGHLNPPHVDRCRSCGQAVTEQSPITVPRPVLGVLHLSTGDDITLDRCVLIGRSPSPDRLVNGERPHIVKLPSPGQDISRNHLEVRIDGWHVLVTDLNSTNGTVVLRPGAPPERLRPDTPTMIDPGTSVSVADEITFTFLASS